MGLPIDVAKTLLIRLRCALRFGKIPRGGKRSGITPPSDETETPQPQGEHMNTTAKKIVAAITIAAFSFMGTAAPAHAAKVEQRTLWCC